MNSSTRLAALARCVLFLGLPAALGAAWLGCGSDGGPGGAHVGGTPEAGAPTDRTSSGDSLQITYSPMYSAYVEGHEAQVPVRLKDPSLRTKGAQFFSSDPTVATVADTIEGATITVKKEGSITVEAVLRGEATGSANLTIKKYTEDQWKLGQARYAKSELAIVPPDGGPLTAQLLRDPNAQNRSGACSTCHDAQAKLLKIEITPTQIAGYSDEELITVFTTGQKPELAAQRTRIPDFVWGPFHAWTVTEDEKQGLIAFLRTQPPRANPLLIDYGIPPCSDAAASFCQHDGRPIAIPAAGERVDAAVPAAAPSDAGAPADAG